MSDLIIVMLGGMFLFLLIVISVLDGFSVAIKVIKSAWNQLE